MSFLGKSNEAITFLERAVEEKASYTPWINSNPGFDSLRSMPRFQALIESRNLPATWIPIRPDTPGYPLFSVNNANW